MRRCFQLAAGGLGFVAPNPLVGCVIVKNDVIIGEGFHREFGKNHAEVNAIESVKDKNSLKGSTLYVNLEPCIHFGKTPPCVDKIIACGISMVVVAGLDPSEKVSGKGIDKLRKSGIEVELGILEKEELELNRRFRTFHSQNRPYIVLKWAQTLDGFMDKERTNGEVGQFKISDDHARQVVHLWRSQESAILVGSNTAEVDDPQLNVRLVNGKNPLRILISPTKEVDMRLKMIADGEETLVVGKGSDTDNVHFIQLNKGPEFLTELMNELWRREIQSIIVEGGKETLQHFIDEGLWDETRIITGNQFIGKGLRAPDLIGKTYEQLNLGDNKLTILRQNL